MPVWLAYLFFPIGVAYVIAAYRMKEKERRWYELDRPTALVWGVFLIAIALDAATIELLPIWGD